MSTCMEEQQHVASSDPEHQFSGYASNISRKEIDSARATKRRKLDCLVPTSARDLFVMFIGLRNNGIAPIPASSPDRPEIPRAHGEPILAESPRRTTLDEVIDQNTVLLPPHRIDATTTHRYMASLSLIQKRALVRELQGNACRVILVERCSLGGCDIIQTGQLSSRPCSHCLYRLRHWQRRYRKNHGGTVRFLSCSRHIRVRGATEPRIRMDIGMAWGRTRTLLRSSKVEKDR